ncbi:MAG: hypothetical protein JXR63_03065 [Spirochaetales bacterium]|nr:hypothetical protein [Spirochaetales bacterium]
MDMLNGRLSDGTISVTSTEDIEKVYEFIKNEKNFIFQYEENGKKRSELILTEGMLSKLKTSELKIIAE